MRRQCKFAKDFAHIDDNEFMKQKTACRKEEKGAHFT